MARSRRRRTSMTPRGRRTVAVATVAAVVGGTFAYFALFPASAPAFVRTTLAKVGLAEAPAPPPPTCPLTGEQVDAVPHRAGLTDENFNIAVDAYVRDPARVEPHNLYTDTASLWHAGSKTKTAPDPLFAYGAWDGKAKKVASAHLPYSGVSDVYWAWSRRHDAWMRSHGTVPHTLEDGSQVSATNVVIQVVDVTSSDILDAAGNPSPEVTQTGHGRAYILLGGRMVAARWERPTMDDTTTYVTKDGTEVTLRPGRTWVELVPSSVAIAFTK